MTSNNLWRIKLVQILLGAAIVIALVLVRGTRAANESVHLTTDWSDHHPVSYTHLDVYKRQVFIRPVCIYRLGFVASRT